MPSVLRLRSAVTSGLAALGRSAVPAVVLGGAVYAPLIVYTIRAGRAAQRAANPEAALHAQLVWFIVALIGSAIASRVLAAMLAPRLLARLDGERPGLGAWLGGSVVTAIATLGTTLGAAALVGLGLAAALVPGALLTCVTWLAAPAAADRRRGPEDALRHSAQRLRGRSLVVAAWRLGLAVIAFAPFFVLRYAQFRHVKKVPLHVADLMVAEIIVLAVLAIVDAGVQAAAYRQLREG